MVLRTHLLPCLFAAFLGGASGLAAQAWGDLDTRMAETFGPGVVSAVWLPDDADPARATTALAIAYLEIPGGNAASIEAAVFARTASGFAPTMRITGIYGADPRDTVFAPDRIEVTTTMPGPDDPRCCPTLPVRWRIDRATGAVTRLD